MYQDKNQQRKAMSKFKVLWNNYPDKKIVASKML